MISTKGIRQCETLGPKTLARWLKSGALLGTMDGRVLLGVAQTSKPSPTAFYAPDFFLQSASPWLFYKHYRSVSLAGLVRALATQPACANDDWVWTSPSFSPFERIFGDLQNEIHQNRLQKGVPFAFERAHIPGDQDGSPARLVAKLRSVLNYATGRAVMPYGFWSITRGTAEGMLGCTPETLFQQDGSQVQTMAVAGTRIAGEENRLPLMEDPKERSEHQIVIDAIVSSVRPLGEVQVKTTDVAHYATLSHLKTAIALELNGGTQFDELVAALHPTPRSGRVPEAIRMAVASQNRSLERHGPRALRRSVRDHLGRRCARALRGRHPQHSMDRFRRGSVRRLRRKRHGCGGKRME